MNNMIDAKTIRVRMAELDMNNRDLARAAGISEATLYRVMRGEDCNVSTLYAIAGGLQLPVKNLFANGSAAESVEA